jgi:aspartyl-tRNA(Asn)/glutamyl-tRNA(Gln) amidotransferase subunit C
MSVSDDDVTRVAGLARLALAPEEVAPLAAELNRILDWIDQLQAVNTADVPAMDMVIPLSPAWRDDVVTDGGIPDRVLANAPAAAHGFFAVPRVIE